MDVKKLVEEWLYMSDFDISGKVAVITGAAGVLCSNIAEHLALNGSRVVLLDIDIEGAKKVADKINNEGGNAIAFKTNVLDKENLIKVKEKILKQYDNIDILINGAGGNKSEATTGNDYSFFELSEDSIKWVFNLNFLGTVLASQVFGEEMSKKGKGSIINISSMAAMRPLTRTIAYSGAKAAVSNFTQWLAVHLNQNYSESIRVNAIAPGFLLTEQNRYLLIDEDSGEETARGKKIKDNTPMNRYGKPDELLGAIIWLSSEASSFVNGIILPIDGGFSAYSGV